MLSKIFVLLSLLLPIGLLAQPLDLSLLQDLNIRNVGPANMSGRITAIDVLVSNPKLMFVGAASGGVWKSENGGMSWVPVFDAQATQNIGSVKIQQDNPAVVWVGTGEGNPRNSMNLGEGIFKSLDGGKTWQCMGLENTKTIHRILVDPTNSNVVYAGAMGDPFSPNEHRGLYKSIDGGKSWKKVLYSNESSGIADLIMDPHNPNKIFAALYDHRRTPYSFVSGGPGSGLFLTLDGGETWKRLGQPEGLPTGEWGRVGVAIAPSDPNRVYAKIECSQNALYRSDDGGEHWYKVNDNPRFTNNRPFYFQDIAVDPADPNRLYNIYQPLTISTDGGRTFVSEPMIPADETKGIHADFHAFWANPKDPHHIIIGGDGGLGISQDHGKSWYFPECIPVAQFYHVNADEELPYQVYGGMQDNGNWSGPAYTWKRGGIRTLYWQYLVGGDGFDISPDPANPRFGYGSSQNGNLYRYDKTTGYYVSIRPPAPDLQTRLRFNWNAGFARDPFDADKAYYGSQFVHLTRDKGANWTIISPDLTTNNPAHQLPDYGGLTLDVSGAEVYNSILSIAPSPLDSNLIWVGTDDGQLQLTRDGGKTWENLTPQIKGMPKEGWIAQLQASSYKAGTVWMVVNNYRKGDYAPYLFKTEDFGKTWINLATYPGVKGYALSVIQDPVEPRLVFLGTENGLWISSDEGKSWTQFQNGFPAVSTMDMVIQKRESALVIGTFGRAIWVLDDLKSLRAIVAGQLKKGITALPVNDAVQVKGLFIAPPGNIWTGFYTTFEGENRPFQRVELPFFLEEYNPEANKVTLSIYDADNREINRLESTDLQKGLNYLTWKLDEQTEVLNGSWVHDETRYIPVLPGAYTLRFSYGSYTDETTIRILPDPRFDLPAEVDVALYRYRKAAAAVVKTMNGCLHDLDSRSALLAKMKDHYATRDQEMLAAIALMEQDLKGLRLKGKPALPGRQIGAWQSFETTAWSKTNDVLDIAAARVTIPSEQDWEQLRMAVQLTQIFREGVDLFLSDNWQSFRKKVETKGFSWFDGN
ncbi:MAG: hypothetical protein NWQ41_05280 [Saprospiraceae bacterium]|nr:hypothetical protein [Saprospiraceae bacterium]